MKQDIILCISFLILTIVGVFLQHPLAIVNGFAFAAYFGKILSRVED